MKPREIFDSFIYFTQCDRLVLEMGSKEFPVAVLQMLLKRNGVLIWENQGSFKLIPSPVLRNLMMHYETARKLDAVYPRIKPSTHMNKITWEQGITISPTVVKALLLTPHKGSDGLSEPDPATNPTGEDQADKP